MSITTSLKAILEQAASNKEQLVTIECKVNELLLTLEEQTNERQPA